MSPFNIKPQQKITVRRTGENQQYMSRIEDLKAGKIYIAIPLSENSPLAVSAGDFLTVRLSLETHCLEFTSQVTGIVIENIPMYAIRYPEQINRIQMRQDVRIDVLLDVMYSLPPGPGADPEFKKAAAVNISAGGIRLSVSEPVPEGTVIVVSFCLSAKGMDHKFELQAKVVRFQAVEGKKQLPVYHLGLSFLDINLRQKDIIYQFIFNKMAQMRRSEKP